MNKEKQNLITLVEDAQKGVEGAFDSLYNESFKHAYRTASLLLKNKQDIEDVLQNSYMYVARYIGDLKNPESFNSWLGVIVKHECQKYISKQKKMSDIFLTVKKTKEFDMTQENDLLVDCIEKSEVREAIAKIVDSLPEDKRACVVLFYYEQHSLSEIAEILGVPEGTVMSRLYYARKKLEKEFKKLQKKDETLFGLSAIPLIVSLFAYQAKTLAVPQSVQTGILTAVTSESVAAASTTSIASASAAAGTVTTAASSAVAAKVTAVAVAACVAIGGGAATVSYTRNSSKETTTQTTSLSSTEEHTTFGGDVSEESSSAFEETTALYTELKSTTVLEKITSTVNTSNSESATTKTETVTSKQSDNTTATAPTNKTTTSVTSTTTAITTNTTTQTTTQTTTEAETTTEKEITTKKITTTAQETAAATEVFNVSDGVLNGYEGSESSVSIPEEVDSSTVTAIGTGAFIGNTDIKSVSLPSTVTRIGMEAFSDCTNLKSISLPSSLESIGVAAFYGCSSLSSVTIPDGTKTISDEAFSYCTVLTSITIPASVTNISEDAFYGSDNVIIRCSEGSAAYEYAVENSINYELI